MDSNNLDYFNTADNDHYTDGAVALYKNVYDVSSSDGVGGENEGVYDFSYVAIDLGSQKKATHFYIGSCTTAAKDKFYKLYGSNNSTNGSDGDWTEIYGTISSSDVGDNSADMGGAFPGNLLTIVSPGDYQWYKVTANPLGSGLGLLRLFGGLTAIESSRYKHYNGNISYHERAPILSDGVDSPYLYLNGYCPYAAIDFGASKAIGGIRIESDENLSGTNAENLVFQGSNNSTDGGDGTWTELADFTGLVLTAGTPSSWYYFSGNYRWYRMYIGTFDVKLRNWYFVEPVRTIVFQQQFANQQQSSIHQMLGGI